MPRDVSLSDSKCWNGGQKWVKSLIVIIQCILSQYTVYYIVKIYTVLYSVHCQFRCIERKSVRVYMLLHVVREFNFAINCLPIIFFFSQLDEAKLLHNCDGQIFISAQFSALRKLYFRFL